MARYRKRKSGSLTEELMDLLLEFTDFSWKFGAIVSAIFLFLSGWTYRWAYAFNHPVNPDHFATAFADGLGWIVYLIPVMLFTLACIFAWRAFVNYSNQSSWK